MELSKKTKQSIYNSNQARTNNAFLRPKAKPDVDGGAWLMARGKLPVCA